MKNTYISSSFSGQHILIISILHQRDIKLIKVNHLYKINNAQTKPNQTKPSIPYLANERRKSKEEESHPAAFDKTKKIKYPS